jgi:hypothetical protein
MLVFGRAYIHHVGQLTGMEASALLKGMHFYWHSHVVATVLLKVMHFSWHCAAWTYIYHAGQLTGVAAFVLVKGMPLSKGMHFY